MGALLLGYPTDPAVSIPGSYTLSGSSEFYSTLLASDIGISSFPATTGFKFHIIAGGVKAESPIEMNINFFAQAGYGGPMMYKRSSWALAGPARGWAEYTIPQTLLADRIILGVSFRGTDGDRVTIQQIGVPIEYTIV